MAHPFLDTSKITQAEFIANGVRDQVASENVEAGRVGTYKNDPKFDQAKAYADVQVPARLPAAMARARDEARAIRGQNPGGQANDDRQQAHEEGEQTDDEEQKADDGGGRADDEEIQDDGEEEERRFDDGLSTITAVSTRGTQDAEADNDSSFNLGELDIAVPDELDAGYAEQADLFRFSFPSAADPFIGRQDQMGGKRLPASAAPDTSRLLGQYKEFVLSKLNISEETRDQVRQLFVKHGWPTVWQSIRSIKGCEGGLNWTWQAVDNLLLVKLKEMGFLSWDKIAEYIFIGMRVSQCSDRYETLDAREREEDSGEDGGEDGDEDDDEDDDDYEDEGEDEGREEED